jgi:3-phytase
MRKFVALAALAAALAACSKEAPPAAPTDGVVEVTASGETEPVGTGGGEDAADDPAIWLNPTDPAGSLIVGTDKKAGLHVYGMDGKSKFFVGDGRLNNVDLVTTADQRVIVVASDRNDEANAKFRLYELDTATPALKPLGTVATGKGEAYGVCLWRSLDGIHAYSVVKQGVIGEYLLEPSGKGFAGKLLRERKVASQPEGCVVDPRDGTLFVGEEDVGIWRFTAQDTAGALIAKADGKHLTADVEGLALVTEGASGGWLVASSQGDNTYALFNLDDLKPAGRFRIAKGTFGSTEETDGIALMLGNFGPAYPAGLFVAQDGENGTLAQNFKLVSWQAVQGALRAK